MGYRLLVYICYGFHNGWIKRVPSADFNIGLCWNESISPRESTSLNTAAGLLLE
ncbi:MAG TPA: hypothetical protein VD905_11410 [Flavobacteriales bacterium]|nr:hypothetical protein [Flavobacteriales bacterium]